MRTSSRYIVVYGNPMQTLSINRNQNRSYCLIIHFGVCYFVGQAVLSCRDWSPYLKVHRLAPASTLQSHLPLGHRTTTGEVEFWYDVLGIVWCWVVVTTTTPLYSNLPLGHGTITEVELWYDFLSIIVHSISFNRGKVFKATKAFCMIQQQNRPMPEGITGCITI